MPPPQTRPRGCARREQGRSWADSAVRGATGITCRAVRTVASAEAPPARRDGKTRRQDTLSLLDRARWRDLRALFRRTGAAQAVQQRLMKRLWRLHLRRVT